MGNPSFFLCTNIKHGEKSVEMESMQILQGKGYNIFFLIIHNQPKLNQNYI